jgi:hypothetical protein
MRNIVSNNRAKFHDDNWTRNEGAFFEERRPLTTATARRTKRRLAAIGDLQKCIFCG